jgi:uncharacterized membrane protein HdeD (DUF308 family)
VPSPVVEESVNATFWQALLLGIATVLLGTAVFAWPDASLRLLGVLVGIWLMFAGLVRILGAFLSWRGLGPQLLSAIVGVLFLVAGVACVRDVAKGVTAIAFFIAVAWMLAGLAYLVTALRHTGNARIWRVALAGAYVIAGFLSLLWPRPTLAVVVVLIGVCALMVGIGEISLAIQLRMSRM